MDIQVDKKKELKLTSARKLVLKLISIQKQPVNAYELLDLYRKVQGSGDAMTIYRALDYLTKVKLIHKIHSQNRYTLCDEHHNDNHVQVFICNQCQKTLEMHSPVLQQEITNLEKQFELKIKESIMEMTGLCKICQDKGDT